MVYLFAFLIVVFHAVKDKIHTGTEEIVFIRDTSKIVCGTKNLTLSPGLIPISYWHLGSNFLIPIGP